MTANHKIAHQILLGLIVILTMALIPASSVSGAMPNSNEQNGIITGTVQLHAAPTPAMIVYALDPITGVWVSVATAASDSVGTYALQVPAGEYLVFANMGIGYASADGWSLGIVVVTPGQTVSDINLAPPSHSECGPMFGIPASPDGQLPELPGPTAECKAALLGDALQPLDDHCANLSVAMEATTGIPMVISDGILIENSWNGLTGNGCQVIGLGDGNNFNSAQSAYETLQGMLLSQGWMENMTMPCLGYGGLGPTATMSCFMRDHATCEVFTMIDPIDMELCSGIDGPIGNCLAALQPEQKAVTVTLVCAEDVLGASTDESEFLSQQFQVAFPPGASDTIMYNSLLPGELHDYVLYAMAGQEMVVDVYVTNNGVEAREKVFIDIGPLGYEPMDMDYPATSTWQGILPRDGEYYIDVKSVAIEPLDYEIYIYIAPLTATEPQVGTGGISGFTNYPEATTPPLHIVATNLETGYWYWIGTAQDTAVYTFPELPPGSYYIDAYTQHGLIGGHTDANGSYIPVMVGAMELVEGITLNWWPRGEVVNDPVGW